MNNTTFDVIIVGGSYSGLAAGMALGRSLKKVLIIDNDSPCNKPAKYSHNFLTQDGISPKIIASLAKLQVKKYDTVNFFNGLATTGFKTETGFEIIVSSGETFKGRKVIFATGIRDIMPDIPGFAESWGISVLHCPYCHGYEIRNETTGILGNGDYGFEFSVLISNWTRNLTLFTNGKSTLTSEQTAKLKRHCIRIVETEIDELEHNNGHLERIQFKDGTKSLIEALYTRCEFQQKCTIPEGLGCELSSDGYVVVDNLQLTTVPGAFACGDNSSRMRTLANAVASGTTAGMMVNKEIIFEGLK